MAGHDGRNLVQVVVGGGVMTLGLLFVLDNAGVIHASHYLRFWPVLLIAVGLAKVAECRTWPHYSMALTWLVMGVVLLGRTLGIVTIGIRHLWPFLIAGAGAFLIIRGWRGMGDSTREAGRAPEPSSVPGDDGWTVPPPPSSSPSVEHQAFVAGGTTEPPQATRTDRVPPLPGGSRGQDVVNAFAVMGGVTRRPDTADFRGGTAAAVMGGAAIDLRGARMARPEAVLEVMAILGGVEIRVPPDWIIVNEVFPFMGGVDDQTGLKPPGSQHRLVLRGLAVLGGVEIKH